MFQPSGGKVVIPSIRHDPLDQALGRTFFVPLADNRLDHAAPVSPHEEGIIWLVQRLQELLKLRRLRCHCTISEELLPRDKNLNRVVPTLRVFPLTELAVDLAKIRRLLGICRREARVVTVEMELPKA